MRSIIANCNPGRSWRMAEAEQRKQNLVTLNHSCEEKIKYFCVFKPIQLDLQTQYVHLKQFEISSSLCALIACYAQAIIRMYVVRSCCCT